MVHITTHWQFIGNYVQCGRLIFSDLSIKINKKVHFVQDTERGSNNNNNNKQIY